MYSRRALAEHLAKPGASLPCADRLRVALENLEAPGEQVAQQAVRHVVAVGLRPALEEAHRLAQELEPVRELEAEAALADARLADDRHLPQAALVRACVWNASPMRASSASRPTIGVSIPSRPRLAMRNARGLARMTR